jgi:AraC-like DNA-binding protein
MRKLYLDREWGIFIGSFKENNFHNHYAIQLSIALDSVIHIEDIEGKVYKSSQLIVKDYVAHKLDCSKPHILILFSPFSKVGHYMQNTVDKQISTFNSTWIEDIRVIGNGYVLGNLSFETFVYRIQEVFSDLDCICTNKNHVIDDRVDSALSYLFVHYERTIPLDEIAEYVNLSPSRFLHLFKLTTGMTYRRAQLWNKIENSLHALKEQNITQTAHQYGFADSAHYSRVFKENFGFSPKFITKM